MAASGSGGGGRQFCLFFIRPDGGLDPPELALEVMHLLRVSGVMASNTARATSLPRLERTGEWVDGKQIRWIEEATPATPDPPS